MKRWLLGSISLLLVGSVCYFFGYARGSAAIAPEEQEALERAFARSMRGVVLEGSFTVDGSDREASTERYTVERVEKVGGDVWLFHARLQFGETDVSLPVPVKLLWAGDTPVVSLTDASIPGLGTYSARLVFSRDRYAGLWSNPRTGGFQFGKITRENAASTIEP